MVFWVCLTMEVKDATAQMQQAERIISLFFLLGAIFFSADYRNVQAGIPLCNSQNRILRICGILLVDFLYLFFCALVLTILESVLA